MLSHWLLDSSVLDVWSMACQTNAECILRFSYVLNSTSSTLNRVYHVDNSTVCGGFYVKSRASYWAAKHSARFYMSTCFTAWMFTWTVPLVSLSLLFKRLPDQNVPLIRRMAICHKGALWKCLVLDEGIYRWCTDGLGEGASDGGRSGWKVTASKWLVHSP